MTTVLHLYGVGFEPLSPPDDPGVGPGPGELRSVAHRGLAALVGEVEPPGPPATARNLSAHERVADRVAAAQAFLPARFGMVAADERSLRTTLLGPREEELRQGLRRIEGCVEMRLTVRHDVDVLLQEALATSASLARLRRRITGRPAAATYYDRIALGEAARNEVLGMQRRDLEALHGRVGPVVRAARALSEPDGTTGRLAYLVESRTLGSFDARLERFGEAHAGRLSMELVGPLAAWDYTDVVDAPSPAGVRFRRRPHGTPAIGG